MSFDLGKTLQPSLQFPSVAAAVTSGRIVLRGANTLAYSTEPTVNVREKKITLTQDINVAQLSLCLQTNKLGRLTLGRH